MPLSCSPRADCFLAENVIEFLLSLKRPNLKKAGEHAMPFSQKTLDFLLTNRLMDSKAWFQDHRGEYEEFVLTPLRQLVIDLSPTIAAIDPLLICEPKVSRSISRIFRDTRFSRDKSIFREVMWCSFMRDRRMFHGLPGFYFEINPAGYSYGCGYYQAAPEAMEAMRDLIRAGDRSYRAARRACEKQDVFQLLDTRYKRTRHPDAEERDRLWLDQRSICLAAEGCDLALLFSPTLHETLASDFMKLLPVYRFLQKAESRVVRV